VPERGLHPQQGAAARGRGDGRGERTCQRLGIDFGAPTVNVDKLRGHKEKVIGKLTGGLAQMAKMRKVTTVRGYGAFVGANHVEVEETTGTGQEKTGTKKVVAFKNAIIAAGSQAVRLPFMPDDPRVVDSTGALALQGVPKRMLIVGGGIIGLEMGTVYSTLGARLDVVEMMDGLMQGADRDLVKVWQKMNATASTTSCSRPRRWAPRPRPKASRCSSRAWTAPRAKAPTTWCCRPWAARPTARRSRRQGRRGRDDRGFINVDIQMRTNVPHIFAIGDIVGQPMLAHKAVHEAHVAAEVIAGELQGNKELASRLQRPRDPQRGLHRPRSGLGGPDRRPGQGPGHQGQEGPVPLDGLGPRHCQRPRRRLHQAAVRRQPRKAGDGHGHGKILGGGMVGTHAGDMIGEIALAIEMGADAVDIGKTIHPHPTLGESIGMAAEVAHGSCTDVPPARK
jgi:dihydrolipoamide dehydrogenase